MEEVHYLFGRPVEVGGDKGNLGWLWKGDSMSFCSLSIFQMSACRLE